MVYFRSSLGSGLLVAVGAVMALLLTDPGGRRVEAGERPPTLFHSGRTFWLRSSQEEAGRRAYAAIAELGRTTDPVDAVGRRWVLVSRSPGLFVGVSFVADGRTDDLVDAAAERVLVSITTVAVESLNREAGEVRAFLLAYLRDGRAPGSARPEPGRERIQTSKPVYEYGEDIVVQWFNTPGHEGDLWRIAGPDSAVGVEALSGLTGGQRDGQAVKTVGQYSFSGLNPPMGGALELEVRLIHGSDRSKIAQRYRFQLRRNE